MVSLRYIPRKFRLLHFISETIPKTYIFSKNFWICGPKIFRPNPFVKSNNSTVSDFESQHKLCFLTFDTEDYSKLHFFQHQNQFRPMSVLSHSGAADSGHFWHVHTDEYAIAQILFDSSLAIKTSELKISIRPVFWKALAFLTKTWLDHVDFLSHGVFSSCPFGTI